MLLCHLPAPALTGLPLPQWLPKAGASAAFVSARSVSNFPCTNQHFGDIGEAEPPRGQSLVAFKVAHSSVSFIVQQLSCC